MKRRTRPSSSGLLTLFDTAIASLTGNSVNEVFIHQRLSVNICSLFGCPDDSETAVSCDVNRLLARR